MKEIMLPILGALLSVIGIVNMTGNISTIHSYNRKRITEENASRYGKAVGIGTLIIGLSMILGFVLNMIANETVGATVMLAAICIGAAFIVYAQIKYNKGIF